MGSFKRNGQSQGPNRRRNKSNAKRHAFLVGLEPLEERRLLSGGVSESSAPLWTPTDTNLFDAQNGPMANLGVGLVDVYKAYVDANGNTSALQSEFPNDEFQNGEVGLQLKMLGGSFSQFVSQLTDVGMNVTTTSATYALVDGYAPVNDLPTIAEMSQTQSGQVNLKPIYSYEGEANNEAETSTFSDVAQTDFNVSGSGVTVGVISDSVNQYNGGLSESYGTGDLSASNPVNVLGDGPSGSDDEGRAMLENIHDIAPGANLAFDTAGNNDLAMSQAVTALATTGNSNIIVDDVEWADDPMFQSGVISQAIETANASGVSYFSAAGNDGPANGYLSAFRGVTASPTGLPSGTYMNFSPNGGSSVEIPITTTIPNASLTFNYDQPFETQEPTGSTGLVTSNVDVYIVDASTGAVVIGAAQNNNNVSIQEPWQFVTIPDAGSYYLAVQVVSGPNPGHIEFASFNDTNTALTVSQEFGSSGSTSYPSSYGHKTIPDTIGVAAVPWWSPAPYLGANPLASEPYSSCGPALFDLSPTGTATAATTVDNPTITAPDGGNTSFFSPGNVINTSAVPPFVPGEPSTPTNLSQDLPSFFGTSSASPNAAAIAALMKQLVPTLTPAEIRAGLIASAESQPMNGQTPGTWNPQGGYGLVNAVDALNAVDLLRVSTTSPANGSTITTAPSVIQVTFNKPVVFSSLSAADLTFTSAPKGVTVNVGAPIAVDNATDPTIVDFPITATGVLANGDYSFSVQSPLNGTAVVAEDGKDLAASGVISFVLEDTTAPVITNTAISGRTVTITFSKALDPSTVTLGNIMVLRKGSATTWPPTPSTLSSYIDLNNDPRATISYNPLTDTVTLDYSNLPQSELPSDNYAIVVLSNTTTGGVTDLVGNSLDGYYTNSFPTTAYQGKPYDFIQNLGFEALQAPQITTFQMTAATDTGIAGDQNTDDSVPSFIGQVYVPFPGSVAGDQVYVQFQGLQAAPNYVTNLAVGSSGRGYTGSYNLVVTTNADGSFSVTAPSALPEGFQDAVAVVVGQADSPPLPGLASTYTDAFRIDKTAPEITAASFAQGGTALPLPNQTPTNTTNITSLSSLSLTVVDPVNPQVAPLGSPAEFDFPAIDPSTASNISNYSLINVSTNTDESQYITSATLVEEPATVNAAGYVTAYNAVINVSFTPGMPFGAYEFIAHTHELQYPGLADAAGNYLDDTSVPYEGTKDFIVNFAIQNTPVYVTSMSLESNYSANGSTAIGSAQSYFELPPSSGTNTRDNVASPPNTVVIDLSNPIPFANYTPDVLLIGSANTSSSTADGDFGTLGEGGLGATGTGFTIVPNTTVTLYSYNVATGTSTQVAAGGQGNRLVLSIAPGTTLAADDYRIYMPNQVDAAGNDTRIFDVYGNQLDGEFLGNQTSQSSPDFPDSPVTIPEYEDELSNGTYRINDMSGDGVAGGAFMTGFTVVPYGNIVYTRPDYVENPLLPSTLSNGSLANPYPVLAPEGDPATAPLNSHGQPNLNSTTFFNQSQFNTEYDLSGDGKFEQSAFYAASQLAYNGPVVIVALPGLPSRNPTTGAVTEASYVMESPAGTGPASGGSASVPYDTTLVMSAGTTLKLQNASLFVQNQGSALQSLGTASSPVTFTSYNNATVGGATNGNPDRSPNSGDWGGIVFRNYDDAITAQQQQFPVDGTLVGANGAAAISGAQDAMSILNFTNISFAGGAVPQGSSVFYSAVTLYNARPMITNDSIANSGSTGSTEGAIAADLDSFREDDTARGPLIRNDSISQNSLNGIYLMAEANGFIESTNAMPYPTNPSTLGGTLNYTFDEPLPLIVLSQLVVGQTLLEQTGGETEWVGDRLYVQPGSMIKFGSGSGLDVLNPAASLNVGSRSYINGYDANNGYNPDSPGFVEEGTTDPNVLFTSVYDDAATTPFVPAINVTGET
ncbi:MAG: S8 family serine peptidase, partial [Isosphaeraceae bacterium]